jgi:CBS domain-containing protein
MRVVSMKVYDIMTKNAFCIKTDDTVSKAISVMTKYMLHQLPVVDGGEITGMLVLKNIVSRDFDHKTKVKNFITKAPLLNSNDSIEDAIEMLLKSGERALVVVKDDELAGIFAETDVFKTDMVRELNDSAYGIMTRCECISKSDSIGKARKLMATKNISRVPVLENGKVIGVVGNHRLASLILASKQSFESFTNKPSRGYKEPQPVDQIRVDSVLRDTMVMDKELRIRDAAALLQKNEEVIINRNGEYHIVTPKDILEVLVRKPEKGVYVQITNLGDEDEATSLQIDNALTDFVKKAGRMVKSADSLNIHIDRHSPGGRIKYAVRTRFSTSMGLLVSHSSAWNLVSAMQDALGNLEKIMKKEHGRRTDRIKKQVKRRE